MLIIAEFGSSPAPAWDFARWCEGAAAVGVGAVKVQLFKAEHFPQAEHDSKRPLEFPRERIQEYMQAARAYGLMAGASVFDHPAIELVAWKCDFVKLAAREQANENLTAITDDITRQHHRLLFRSISDLRYLDALKPSPYLTTLFTIQKYPAGMVESVMALLRAAMFFKSQHARWGWSSHTLGDWDCVLAKQLGASVLEKHFCMGASDIESGHSLLPHQFAAMVRRLNSI